MDLIAPFHDFHFLRPLWLFAIPVLLLAVWWRARARAAEGAWTQVIDPDLLGALRLDERATASGLSPWPWLGVAWIVATLALAGPTWERESSAAYRGSAAWVIVLDLSSSMTAEDVTPNRSTRARYALDDLLTAARDLRVALVVFSGEPHVVTPLTEDVATVRALLPPLAPGIMPTVGDNLAPALDEAGRLLEASGVKTPRVVVITDGFADPSASFAAVSRLRGRGADVSVVGIGTAAGAPYRTPDGFEQDERGQPRMAHFDADPLRELARTGGGTYTGLDGLASFGAALGRDAGGDREASDAPDLQLTQWRDAGAWLLPLLLLLALALSRRGWL
ncbi:MAG TPA: VWA domain-containing protein [Nevskiaceae bacterium]|nr:VWA domain-containing protein [Nevskiaceae bacterium]